MSVIARIQRQEKIERKEAPEQKENLAQENRSNSFVFGGRRISQFQTLNEWETGGFLEPGGTEKVELLKTYDQSLFWRITSGNIQTIIKGHFKVFCHFPVANPMYSVTNDWIRENGYPLSWPSMVSHQKIDFFQDHSLESIEKSETNQKIKLVFSANYTKIKSRFNDDVFITPYEWGVTLISCSRESDSLGGGFGHALIIIESIKNGRYYIEQADITLPSQTTKETPSNALEVRLDERFLDRKTKRYKYLKDYEDLNEKFPNLKHTRTWIRKKDSVQHMLNIIEGMKRRQTPEKPLFLLDRAGKHDSFTVSGAICQTHNLLFPCMSDDENWTNCIIWAVERLHEADINIDTGLIIKYFATIPRDYASLSTSTLDEADHPKSRRSWKAVLSSQVNNANGSLRQIFMGGFFGIPRRNFFVQSGRPSDATQEKTIRLIEEQFLSSQRHKSYVKYTARQLMLRNQPTGISFNRNEYSNFLEPLMESIIKNGNLSESLILRMLRIYNAHLDIKEPGSWGEKEDYLIDPKTYEDTIEKILAHCLRIEVAEKMQSSIRFGHPNHEMFF